MSDPVAPESIDPGPIDPTPVVKDPPPMADERFETDPLIETLLLNVGSGVLPNQDDPTVFLVRALHPDDLDVVEKAVQVNVSRPDQIQSLLLDQLGSLKPTGGRLDPGKLPPGKTPKIIRPPQL